MKIIQLDIEGFRSLKKVSWKPGDLNILIGPNGTGKSNLLRFVELISVSAQGRLGRYIQSLGGMDAIVWDGQVSNISFRLETSPVDKNVPPQDETMTYGLKLERLGQSSAYRIQKELASIESKGPKAQFKCLQRDGHSARIFKANGHGSISPTNPIPEDETLLSTTSSPWTHNTSMTFFQQELASWTAYHALRIDKDAQIRRPVITRREQQVDADGQNLSSVLHTLYTSHRRFKKDIDDAMNVAFDDEFEELVFTPASDGRIQLRVRWASLQREQSAADLSDGILRFLLLLTILSSPSPPSLIAIDEPATGLHPSMLPILAEYAVDAADRTQVIFTTHSSQFLNAFTETQPTVTVTKWEDGETHLVTLDKEELDYWLDKFHLGRLYESGTLENMT